MTAKPKKLMPEREWQMSLPAKRVSAQLIVKNKQGKYLLVKPNYRDYWILPGGVVEKDEAPLQAMHREVKEEIGVSLPNIRFAGIDYSYLHKHNLPDWIHVLFEADEPSEELIAQFVPEEGEIEDIAFMDADEYRAKAHETISARLDVLDEIQPPYYLENGHLVQ